MAHGAPLKLHHGSAITGREQSLIVGYEMDAQEGVLINKEVTGLGGGSDGTLAGARQMQDSIHGNGLRFDGAQYATYTQTGDVHTEGTILLTVRPQYLDNNVRYIHCAENTDRWNIYFDTTDLYTRFGDAAAQDTGYDGDIGKSFRLAVTWSATHVWVFLDGNLIDDYDATFSNDFATGYLGSDTAPANYLYGEESEFELVRRQLSATEILRDYLQYARRAHYLESFRAAHVLATGVASGTLESTWWEVTQVNGTDIRISHSIATERMFGIRNSKYIDAVGAGDIWIPTQRLGLRAADPEAAFGTWDIWWRATAPGKLLPGMFWFVADTPSMFAVSGYCLIVTVDGEVGVVETTGGGGTTIFMTDTGVVAADEWHRYRIARRYDGRFTLYIDGAPAVPVAPYTNPFTDLTHLSGSYLYTFGMAGDGIGPISHRWGECL